MNFVSVLKRTFQLEMKSTVHGQDLDRSLAPLLQRIYENGNNNLLYKSNQRDITVKKICFGTPNSHRYRRLQTTAKISERCSACLFDDSKNDGVKTTNDGENFIFQRASNSSEGIHVHVQLDDTIIRNEVSYDAFTDRFVGFILVLVNSLPIGVTFI